MLWPHLITGGKFGGDAGQFTACVAWPLAGDACVVGDGRAGFLDHLVGEFFSDLGGEYEAGAGSHIGDATGVCALWVLTRGPPRHDVRCRGFGLGWLSASCGRADHGK